MQIPGDLTDLAIHSKQRSLLYLENEECIKQTRMAGNLKGTLALLTSPLFLAVSDPPVSTYSELITSKGA